MTNLNGKSVARDELLDEVVVAYLEAVESGEVPDAREWQDRYPQLASELADFFADHEDVNRMTAPLRKTAHSPRARAEDLNRTVDYRPSPLLPTRIGAGGDYLLIEEIARGGMGVVYLARQVSLNRMVAVKMIISGYMASGAEIQRFHAEAIAAAHLDQPNIVPIYEVGEFEGQPFYSMKVLEGGSLADRLTEMRERPRCAAELLLKVAHAVHHAHQRGILHRDLKPGNVLLDRSGEPYVSDFGLSKRIEDGTDSGIVVGTPGYMAPEQAAGAERPTTSADVYSLGAVLYALLTGRPPFVGESRLDILKQLAEEAPVAPRTLNPLVDRDLETICLKCLRKTTAERYGSAGDLAEDLRCYLAGEAIKARPMSVIGRGLRWVKRRPALAALQVVALACFLTMILAYVWYQQHRASVAERNLNERHRTDSLRDEVQELVLQGRQAMATERWSDAAVHFASARGLLGAEKALADLHASIAGLLEDANRGLQGDLARREALRRIQKFRELRADALFQGTRLTAASMSSNRERIRNTARRALHLFGVNEGSGTGPVVDSRYTVSQRREVVEGSYELLLILAEAAAGGNSPRWKEALAILDRAAALGVDSKAAHLQRARYLEGMGDKPAATLSRETAAARQLHTASDHFLTGEECLRQGNVSAAINAFRQALILQPDHFWARYFLAVSNLRVQPSKPDLAADGLTACLAQERNVAWVYLLRGVAHGQLNLFGAAQDDFQKTLDLGPSDDARYAVLVNRAVLHSRQRQFERAIADLTQAIALKPSQYQAYSGLASVYQRQNRVAAAIERMDRAVASASVLFKAGNLERPELANLYRGRAQLLAWRAELPPALRDLTQSIALDPRPQDHAERGRLLHRLGSFRDALDAYDAALKADPNHSGAHLGRAQAQCSLADWPGAIASLDEYVKRIGPDASPSILAGVFQSRGLARTRLGKYAEAISDFSSALNHEESSIVRTYRGWAYLASMAHQLALADFEKAIRLDGKNADAYNGRGAVRALLAAKPVQFRAAISDAETALALGPKNNPRLLCNAARIYAQAAAKLVGERDYVLSKIRVQYRERALHLLREALKATPAAERPAFLLQSLQTDEVLSEFVVPLKSARIDFEVQRDDNRFQ
jgi:eukaryotic-like serine/threonine-protein kinase